MLYAFDYESGDLGIIPDVPQKKLIHFSVDVWALVIYTRRNRVEQLVEYEYNSLRMCIYNGSDIQ